MSVNRLKLNPAKTEFVIIGIPSKSLHSMTVRRFDLGGVLLKTVSSVKLLDVNIAMLI